ncbi:MAG: hypothetical protein AAF515_07595 [Pseudomonadota bacterium]
MRSPLAIARLTAPAVALVCLTLAAPALATQKLSYNYGTVGYVGSGDIVGVSAYSSGQINRNWRTTGEYRYTDDDATATADVKAHTGFLSLGYMVRTLPRADILLDAGMFFTHVRAEFATGGNAKGNDAGMFGSLGFRWIIGERWEVEPRVRYYHTLEDSGDGWDIGLTGRYYLMENLGVYVSIEDSDFWNETLFQLGLRFGEQRDLQNF